MLIASYSHCTTFAQYDATHPITNSRLLGIIPTSFSFVNQRSQEIAHLLLSSLTNSSHTYGLNKEGTFGRKQM